MKQILNEPPILSVAKPSQATLSWLLYSIIIKCLVYLVVNLIICSTFPAKVAITFIFFIKFSMLDFSSKFSLLKNFLQINFKVKLQLQLYATLYAFKQNFGNAIEDITDQFRLSHKLPKARCQNIKALMPMLRRAINDREILKRYYHHHRPILCGWQQ